MHYPEFFRLNRLELMHHPDDFGIYIHVPFCLRRCRYCAFVSSVWKQVPSTQYASAICREFDIRKSTVRQKSLKTLYFGGGTPSTLDDECIEKIITHIAEDYGIPTEVTLEANPEHITQERARRWKKLGISRISLGIQSFDDAMLSFLGRHHTGKQAGEVIEILHSAGFDEISIDLIYGAFSGSDEIARWNRELETARHYHPAHVSCYELTPEANTPIGTALKRGQQVLCDDEIIAEMMTMIPEKLKMTQYEISNYSRDGYLSRHNVSCWAGLPYLGLGPGAHSLIIENDNGHLDFVRQANSSNVRAWLKAFESAPNELPAPDFIEHLDAQTHLAERLMCAARTRFWWSAEEIASSIGATENPFMPGLKKAVEQELLEITPDHRMRTTPRGIILNNRLDELIFSYES